MFQVHSLENETTNSSERENENAEELECYSNTTAPCVDSENSVAKTEPLAHSNEKSEICSMHDILSHKLSGEKELRLAVDNVLRNENLAEIGELILAGYGEWLLPVKSENQTIRELVRHLPIYLVSFCFIVVILYVDTYRLSLLIRMLKFYLPR